MWDALKKVEERHAEIDASLSDPAVARDPRKMRDLSKERAQLDVTIRTVQAYREAISDFFARMPAATWATSLPGGRSGTTVPTLCAELGDAAGRWESFRHLQAHAGSVPVTDRSGKYVAVFFRFACNRHLRQAVHQFTANSLAHSEWAKAYYDRCRKRGHRHHHALRALSAKWLKILFAL